MTPACRLCGRPGCPLCWLARHDARYMEAWGIPGDPEPVPPGSEFRPAVVRESAPPCAHLGDPLTGAERERLGLTHLRDWRRCEVGHGEPPGVVCTCFLHPRGCKGCPDYRAEG